MGHARDRGEIPVTRVPWVNGTANGDVHETYGHGANTRFISYNTCIRSTGDRLGVIPLKRAFFEAVRVRSGVEEVGVHGTSWK